MNEERLKLLAALQRAIPVTRMVDYGVPLGEALAVHARVSEEDPPAWDDVCERQAVALVQMASEAERAGHRFTASLAWRSASALYQCAQLAFNADTPRKAALYEEAHSALVHHAQCSGDLEEMVLSTAQGLLHGWVVRPAQTARAAVLIVGGLSGWGGVYLDMGRALAQRGIVALLADGPGQGLTRMRGHIHLDADTLPMFGAFISHARALGAEQVGTWGNSFGGLFAAHIAAADPGVRAVCINGAPMVPAVPGFRTAVEQMNAVFGVDDETALASRLRMLAMQRGMHRIAAAMLVVEGGRDPLVPAGTQAAFFELAAAERCRLLSWPDGEHTVYNHAPQRNALVADWFREQLSA